MGSIGIGIVSEQGRGSLLFIWSGRNLVVEDKLQQVLELVLQGGSPAHDVGGLSHGHHLFLLIALCVLNITYEEFLCASVQIINLVEDLIGKAHHFLSLARYCYTNTLRNLGRC